MHAYTVASCYKFVTIHDPDLFKPDILNTMKKYRILGTFILATEGLNAGFSGTAEDMQKMYTFLRADPRLTDLIFKETYTDTMPFERRKVKLRSEIVTLGVPGTEALITKETHLSPEDWNKLLDDPDVLVLDARNHYEVTLGQFRGAVDPKIDTFREFPAYVEKNLLDKKKCTIAMYCTGGIRCEKSTAYFKNLGFENVYQLDGGILNYIDTIPEEESKWDGSCFVFDDRMAI